MYTSHVATYWNVKMKLLKLYLCKNLFGLCFLSVYHQHVDILAKGVSMCVCVCVYWGEGIGKRWVP